MPGRVFIAEPLSRAAELLGVACDVEDPGPRNDLAPGEEVAVLIGDPRSLRVMRWNMIMSGRVNARGRPVMETITNARSETLFSKSAYAGVRRAVLPVNGWYEWTGKTRRKTRWRMRPDSGGWFLFAAIWDIWTAPGGLEIAQMATVTVEPNADVVDYHHRMPALLEYKDIDVWMTGPPEAAEAALRPAPPGTVIVEDAGFR